jgi:deoxyadenosine/deoxycytidine kinase
MLSKSLGSRIQCIQEPIHEWTKNDLLTSFYKETERWSFTFENFVQLCRLKNHYTTINDVIHCIDENASMKFIERSLWSSFNVFAKNSFEENRLRNFEYDILKAYYDIFSEKIIETSKNKLLPFDIIYLRTNPDVCYQRLNLRLRPEDHHISPDYLIKIHMKYEAWIDHVVKNKLATVHIIDGTGCREETLKQIYLLNID